MLRVTHSTLAAGIRPMADLADFYPAAQTVPQTVNGTQPVVPRTAAPAGYAAGGGAGAPALWVIIIVAAGILLLHAGE